jgi:hypothetical protein
MRVKKVDTMERLVYKSDKIDSPNLITSHMDILDQILKIEDRIVCQIAFGLKDGRFKKGMHINTVESRFLKAYMYITIRTNTTDPKKIPECVREAEYIVKPILKDLVESDYVDYILNTIQPIEPKYKVTTISPPEWQLRIKPNINYDFIRKVITYGYNMALKTKLYGVNTYLQHQFENYQNNQI